MQLYGLVNEFRLHALVSNELEQDCRSCGRCRFLLASCAMRHQDANSSDGSEAASCEGSSSGSDAEELDRPCNSETTSAAAASVCVRDINLVD
jgi:hypothetical protein